MGKLLITDGELRRAAAAVRDAMLASIPAEEDCPYEFSPEFEERIFRLYEEKRAEKKKPKHRVLRRVAAIFLAAVIGFGVWMAADPVARAAVTRWFREVYENQIIYRFTGEEEAKVLPDFELTWIPDGYVRADAFHDNLARVVMYGPAGSEVDGFMLSYNLMTDGLAVMVDDSDGTGIPVEINGAKGYFYPGTESSPGNILIWVREDFNVVIEIGSPLSQADIMHIAEGLKLYNPPKK